VFDTELRSVFVNYLNAFFAESAAEQERLMRSSVAEDIMFSNPGVSGRGLTSLLGHISRFQQRFGGGSFRINWFRQQHGQMLAEWTQFNKDGSEFITANSYARCDENGRIVQFSGFWEH
jgi:hypothetical protein